MLPLKDQLPRPSKMKLQPFCTFAKCHGTGWEIEQISLDLGAAKAPFGQFLVELASKKKENYQKLVGTSSFKPEI